MTCIDECSSEKGHILYIVIIVIQLQCVIYTFYKPYYKAIYIALAQV